MNMSEKQLRRVFEERFCLRAADAKGRLSHRYGRWLEDIVRLYWPELQALMAKETKRTFAIAARHSQMSILQIEKAS